MGLFSRFENKAEDVIEGSGGRGGIEPVKLAKRAYKEMQREKMIGVGNEYAPTLYNVLLSPEDDRRMSGYYPSLAGEIETYLTGRADQAGLVFDCPPLVRFIVDEGLKRGRFDIIAESVSPAIIKELRHEEMVHYGIERDTVKPVQEETPGDDAFAPQTYDPTPAPAPAPTPEPEPEPEPTPYQPAEDYVPYQPEGDLDDYEDYLQSTEDDGYQEPVVEEPAAQPERHYPPTHVPLEEPAAAVAASAVAGSADSTVLLNNGTPVIPHAALYDYKQQRRYPLRGSRTIIGRETTCDVVISVPSVSRRHAEILYGEKGWLVRDTGSTNGITVNGKAVGQTQIYDGDIIGMGTAQLEFQEG